MNKYLLALGSLVIAFNANAFSWSDLNPFSSNDEETTMQMPSADEIKVKAAAASITEYFSSNSILEITDEQKQMLKTSYDYLKEQEITNPELKQVADKAISLIDTSGVFDDSTGFTDSLIR
tara:strand:+ start:374 stop:736 length:363 start_codon:yes stop_codon:yes gene_type:complete